MEGDDEDFLEMEEELDDLMSGLTSGGACMRLRCWVKRSFRTKRPPWVGRLREVEDREDEEEEKEGWVLKVLVYIVSPDLEDEAEGGTWVW